MIRITVANDQAEKLRLGRDAIELVDEKGDVIGCYAQAFSSVEIAEAKRRSALEQGGRITAEILDRLAGLV
jgi:hypothetical protein